MPNDAKLGLVAGLGLVIVIAVVFYRKDPNAPQPQAAEASATTVNAVGPAPVAPIRGQYRPAWAKTALRSEKTVRHIVTEGETLISLAQRYYGNANQSARIFQANRQVIPTPDRLIPGTVLDIPDPVSGP